MVARVVTVAFQGVDARRVDVEVQLTLGEPFFLIVGLGEGEPVVRSYRIVAGQVEEEPVVLRE